MTGVIDYTTPGVFTRLDGVEPRALEVLPREPVGICRVVGKLVVQPGEAREVGLGDGRLGENQVRSAGWLVRRLLEMNPAPLTVGREPGERVVGTCRHFAVLACALLRWRGVAARARCGFATYFQAGQGVDHWVVEYREAGRWVRVDPEVLGGNAVRRPEAWSAYRRGEIDAARFGVHGTENWGPSEIRGNAVRDLAALNQVETLPWDEWGRMTEAYQGKTGAGWRVPEEVMR